MQIRIPHTPGLVKKVCAAAVVLVFGSPVVPLGAAGAGRPTVSGSGARGEAKIRRKDAASAKGVKESKGKAEKKGRRGGSKAKGAGGEKGSSDKVLVWLRVGKVVEGGVEVEVQPFQRLQDIAKAYGLTNEVIAKANPSLDANNIKVGQKVFVPGATSVKAIKTAVPADRLDELEGLSPHASYGATGFSQSKQLGNEDKGKGKEKGDFSRPTIVSGKVVRGGVLHTVMAGQTLWDIANAYGVKKSAILKANSIENENRIKVGKKIVIPGAKEVVAVPYDPSGGAKAMFLHPVTFHRIHTGTTQSLRLFTPGGKLIKSQYALLEKLLYDQRTGKTHKIHPRLVFLLVKVAHHFSFRTIIIYSGFRQYKKGQNPKKSKHNVGRAVDFAVSGVSNWQLARYCRTFGNVGVGYYPNSYFVHLDVREKPAFWVDYSKPGEKPKYRRLKPGLEKKAPRGAIPPAAGVEEEAESDVVEVEVGS